LTAPQHSQIRVFMEENYVNYGTAAMFLGFIPGEILGNALKTKLGIQVVKPKGMPIPTKMKRVLTSEQAKMLELFPLNYVEESGQRILLLGMTDPLDSSAASKVEQLTRARVQPVFVGLDHLQALYKAFYGSGLDLFPPDVTSMNEGVAEERVAAASSAPVQAVTAVPQAIVPTPNGSLQDPWFKALLSLLFKKRIITLEEWQRETKNLT